MISVNKNVKWPVYMIKEVIWTYNLLGMIWEGTYIVRPTFNRFMTWSIYGIRRQLIGVGFITEVRQRRARFIIGWVTAWGTGRKRTSMDVGAVSIRRDPKKSTMCEYLAHKANLLGMKIA